MDVACSLLQMTDTLKQVFWMIKRHGDVSIAVGAFVDMDRLPDFNGVVAYPDLLAPQKNLSKEGAILPYFPNLVEAIPGEFNATSFFMAMKLSGRQHSKFGHTPSNFRQTKPILRTSHPRHFATH
jgi:hypothetical protein